MRGARAEYVGFASPCEGECPTVKWREEGRYGGREGEGQFGTAAAAASGLPCNQAPLLPASAPQMINLRLPRP